MECKDYIKRLFWGLIYKKNKITCYFLHFKIKYNKKGEKNVFKKTRDARV